MAVALEPGEYEALVARADGGNNTSASIELLFQMRTNRIHEPELICLVGGKVLSGHQGKLGNELWNTLEQVFLAAAEVGADKWREYTLSALQAKFPSSTRVKRLTGIEAEAKQDWAEANKIYQDILAEKPEDAHVRKRAIAIHRQRGKVNEAIEEANKYLDLFVTDAEVWHELGEMYIEAGHLSRAVFCFEELVMSNPRQMYNILTYAELLYTTGDFELCRKYYSLAAYIDDGCLRALWGLVAVNMALAEKDKSQERMVQLQSMTTDKLKGIYKPLGQHGKLALTLLPSLLP